MNNLTDKQKDELYTLGRLYGPQNKSYNIV